MEVWRDGGKKENRIKGRKKERERNRDRETKGQKAREKWIKAKGDRERQRD